MSAALEFSRALGRGDSHGCQSMSAHSGLSIQKPARTHVRAGSDAPVFCALLGLFLTLDQGTTACLSVSQRQLTTKFHWPEGVEKGLAGLLLLVPMGTGVHRW